MADGMGVPPAGQPAGKDYSSFLVRWWHLRGDERRLEIEHIQSGQRTRVASPSDAVAWMSARQTGSTAEPEPRPRSEAEPPFPHRDWTD